MNIRTSTLSLLLVLTACAGQGDTQPPLRSNVATHIVTTSDARLRAQDAELTAALAAAENGQWQAGRFPALAQPPLQAWLEYAQLRQGIDTLDIGRAESFLARHGQSAAGLRFRNEWLAALGRRAEWAAITRTWQPGIERPALRCIWLEARRQQGQTDSAWMQDVRALWLTEKALPPACQNVISHWQRQGGLDDALRWQRIDLAIAANQPATLNEAAAGFPPAAATLARSYATALSTGKLEDARHWPQDARSRQVVSSALLAMAKKSPDAAEAALPGYQARFDLNEAERGRVLYEIALQTAASYLPESARRLAAVPVASRDERLYQLMLREALARRAWAEALQIIEGFPQALADKPQNLYFRARLMEMTGKAGAPALYQQAARHPEFHGFLAADRLQAPYPLCPWTPEVQPALEKTIADNPGLQSAFALYRIGRREWASAEWNHTLKTLGDAERRIAVAQAQQHGWFDRAVFALARENRDELRLYALRFPLAYREVIEREAKKHALDPAWIAAEIRAESLFDAQARSQANAIGLMQVLPATGEATATRAAIPWQGVQTLYQPETNIAIGTAYLREMKNRWPHLPAAIAAYNAGPTPTARWQSQRPDFDADFWIETISYRETREYVPRVLAFSVIYDWRMRGDALRISERISGNLQGRRVQFHCPQ
ncbi:MAG: transglycosylase SLT domain-containing protein [Pseudomonadota bacterium]|nr:transglycosylase SLT domain-containing protein [Pseudomonadota bacterium]